MKRRKPSSSLDLHKMFPRPGPFRKPPPVHPSDLLDPKAFLPGGTVHENKLLTGPQSQERLLFITDAWVLDGLDAPSFIPNHLATDVRLLRPEALKAGGLVRRQHRLADEAARLRDAGRKLRIVRRGRPAGPSLEANRTQFEAAVKKAIATLTDREERITLLSVATELGRASKTLSRDLSAHGFLSWKALLRALTK